MKIKDLEKFIDIELIVAKNTIHRGDKKILWVSNYDILEYQNDFISKSMVRWKIPSIILKRMGMKEDLWEGVNVDIFEAIKETKSKKYKEQKECSWFYDIVKKVELKLEKERGNKQNEKKLKQ